MNRFYRGAQMLVLLRHDLGRHALVAPARAQDVGEGDRRFGHAAHESSELRGCLDPRRRAHVRPLGHGGVSVLELAVGVVVVRAAGAGAVPIGHAVLEIVGNIGVSGDALFEAEGATLSGPVRPTVRW